MSNQALNEGQKANITSFSEARKCVDTWVRKIEGYYLNPFLTFSRMLAIVEPAES
jgi:hypothetical protein